MSSFRPQISTAHKKAPRASFTGSILLTLRPCMIGLVRGLTPLDTILLLSPQTRITLLVSMRNLALSMEKCMNKMSRKVKHGSMHASTTILLTIKIWQLLSRCRTRTFRRVTSMTVANISSSLSMILAFFWSSSLRTLTVLTVALGWMGGSMRPVSPSTSSGSWYHTSSWPSSQNSLSTSSPTRRWPSTNSQPSGSISESTMEIKRINFLGLWCTFRMTRSSEPSIAHLGGITSRVPSLPPLFTLNFTGHNNNQLKKRPDS